MEVWVESGLRLPFMGFGLDLGVGIIEKAADLVTPDELVRRIRIAFLGSHR
jgi:hypothetical protein